MLNKTKLNKINKKDMQPLSTITNFLSNFDVDDKEDGGNHIRQKKLKIHIFYGSLKSMFSIHLIRNYFDDDYADKLFNDLKQIRYNSDEESMIRMYGKRVKIPRQQTAYGELGTTYHFSGISVAARDWTLDDGTVNTRVGHELQHISKLVGRSSCSKFNYALINNYHDQNDNIGYHSDDEKELGEYPIVAGISLGHAREIYFKSNLTGEVKKILLPHNSLVIMHYPTNSNWKHSIPKKPTQLMGQRISLTFRSVGEKRRK